MKMRRLGAIDLHVLEYGLNGHGPQRAIEGTISLLVLRRDTQRGELLAADAQAQIDGRKLSGAVIR